MTQRLSLDVLLFASWADALGASQKVELPVGATVADLLATLSARVVGTALPKPVVALNQRYARPTETISAGDEVAIIPPVAGG